MREAEEATTDWLAELANQFGGPHHKQAAAALDELDRLYAIEARARDFLADPRVDEVSRAQWRAAVYILSQA